MRVAGVTCALLAFTLSAPADAPFAATQRPAPITSTSATLNGMATPNGTPSFAWFEWGTTNFAQQTEVFDVGNATNVVRVTSSISGLVPRSFYKCRLVVSNEQGIAFGAEQRFATGRPIVVWGNNFYQQTNAPLDLTNVVAISAGDYTSCALSVDGTVTAWGNNYYNQTNVPNSLTNVIAVAAGALHCIALKSDGTVVAWGDNSRFQTNVPKDLTNVIAIAAGGTYTLALKDNGTVVAWGDNNIGQTQVPTNLVNVVAISAGPGSTHSLALKADGTIIGWGNNAAGQATPPPGLTNVIAIASGGTHSLALKSDGKVVVWGRNVQAPLNPPVSLSNVVTIGSGAEHSFAIKADGTAISWGGYNSYFETNIPPLLNNLVMAEGGENHSIVLGNRFPTLGNVSVSGYVNSDLVVTLAATDPDGDNLKCRISQLSSGGVIYQYVAGARGEPITNTNTLISDPLHRIIFAPQEGTGPYSPSFSFVATDGWSDPIPKPVSVFFWLPPAPALTNYGVANSQNFQFQFGAPSNATYRVWSSTNLIDWQVVGTATQATPGTFQFHDDTLATNASKRFFRVGAP
jgi:Regulator of chromosome condensation (RCC1) repeat